MKRKVFIFILCSLFFAHFAFGQNVSNVTAYQEGQNIVISYDLSSSANIDVEMTIQGVKHSLKSLSGDIGRMVKAGKNNKIIWNVLEDEGNTFDAENVVFTVRASSVWRTFMVAEGAMSFAPMQGSVGLMVGRVARWGYYAKFRSSFMFATPSGTFSQNDAYLNGYGSMSMSELRTLFTGSKRNMELIADLGTMYNMSRNWDIPVCIYFGGGFGMRRQMWEIDNHNWVQYSQSSYVGFSGDLGFLASIKGFTIDVGVNTINFQYMEVQLGLGWMFNK